MLNSDAIALAAQDEKIVARFWSKVEKTEACWNWMGALMHRGYGHFGFMVPVRVTLRCHRMSWTIANGRVPDGLNVLHTCDNRACVNPSHLFLGTAADNTRDMVRKGRAKGNPAQGEDCTGSKLTGDDVRAIRSSALRSRVLAEQFGVTRTHINRIKNRDCWRFV